MKSKRVLGLLIVLTFTVVSIFGCFNVSAAVTHVKVPDYLPEVGTILLDDDFEGSYYNPSNYINTDYENGCVNGNINLSSIVTEDNNKYLTMGKSKYTKTRKTGSIEADKLVVAFDIMPTINKVTIFSLSFGGIKVGSNTWYTPTSAIQFKLDTIAGSTDKCALTLRTAETTESERTQLFSTGNEGISTTSFSKIAMIFEKNGTDAKLSELYINNIKKPLEAEKVLPSKWFDIDSGSNNVYIGNYTVADVISVDNMLVYTAADNVTGIKNINLTSKTLDVQNADATTLTGKLIVAGYDASGNLVGVNSNSEVNVSAGTTSPVSFSLPEGTAASYKFFVWNGGFEERVPCLRTMQVFNE